MASANSSTRAHRSSGTSNTIDVRWFLFKLTAQEGQLSSKRRFSELGTRAPGFTQPGVGVVVCNGIEIEAVIDRKTGRNVVILFRA
jgi:hypothetical protein